MRQKIIDRIQETQNVLKSFTEQQISLLEKAARIISKALEKNNKIMLCGNGGSAAQAQHFAAEFVIRYQKDREALPAIALTTDTSILTAGANDYGFNTIFERQVEAYGKEGDVLIAISTSGKSENVNRAVKKARGKGLKVIYLCGEALPPVSEHCDVVINVPSTRTPVIQEIHEIIGHLLVELVELLREGGENV